MACEEDKQYPLDLYVVAGAKVSEVIGLALWKYSTENRQPPITAKDTENFSLYMGIIL